MANATHTTFDNQTNAALADMIGELDGQVKALESRISEAKAELKARGVIVAAGERYTITRTDAARISLDTSAIRKTMGDVWCQTFEKIAGVTSFRIGPARTALAA